MPVLDCVMGIVLYRRIKLGLKASLYNEMKYRFLNKDKWWYVIERLCRVRLLIKI